MNEASLALCAGLLGARAWNFLQQHRSMHEALADAKRQVRQQLGNAAEEAEALVPAGGRGAAKQPAPAAWQQRGALQQQQQQQQEYRTPAVGIERGGAAGGSGRAAQEVSPLVQRGRQGLEGGQFKGGQEGGQSVGHVVGCLAIPARRRSRFAQLTSALGMSPAGLILNEETGHIIGIGKATYNRLGKEITVNSAHSRQDSTAPPCSPRCPVPLLPPACAVDQGYVVDRMAGTITPPPPSPESPARAIRGSAPSRRPRRTP